MTSCTIFKTVGNYFLSASSCSSKTLNQKSGEESNNVEVVSQDGETNFQNEAEDEHSLDYYKEVFYTYVYSDNCPCVSDIKEHYLYKNTETASGKAFKEAVDKILEKGLFIQMAEGEYMINEIEEKYSEGEIEPPTVAYEDFFNIKDCIIENGLNIKKNTDNETCLFAEGELDLNKDGKKDEITLKLKYENESTIKINNSEMKIYFEYPSASYLVDLIKDDEFIEIAILDQGPSADPYTAFYRYDGESIQPISGGFYTEITSEDPVNIYYGQVLTNGKGMFISPIDIVQFVSPKIIKGYRTIEDNKFIYHPVDYNDALNKEYTITTDFEAFFNKKDKNDNSSEKGDIFD